jgi:hypothetical protein
MSNENDGQQDTSGYGSGSGNNDESESNGTNLIVVYVRKNRFQLFILFFMVCVV